MIDVEAKTCQMTGDTIQIRNVYHTATDALKVKEHDPVQGAVLKKMRELLNTGQYVSVPANSMQEFKNCYDFARYYSVYSQMLGSYRHVPSFDDMDTDIAATAGISHLFKSILCEIREKRTDLESWIASALQYDETDVIDACRFIDVPEGHISNPIQKSVAEEYTQRAISDIDAFLTYILKRSVSGYGLLEFGSGVCVIKYFSGNVFKERTMRIHVNNKLSRILEIIRVPSHDALWL